MNEKIKKALITLLNEEVIIASWGIANMTINPTSFEFQVEGFIYQGRVKIDILDDGYRVGFETGTSFDCSDEDLVTILDRHIEKTNDYLDKLEHLIFPE